MVLYHNTGYSIHHHFQSGSLSLVGRICWQGFKRITKLLAWEASPLDAMSEGPSSTPSWRDLFQRWCIDRRSWIASSLIPFSFIRHGALWNKFPAVTRYQVLLKARRQPHRVPNNNASTCKAAGSDLQQE